MWLLGGGTVVVVGLASVYAWTTYAKRQRADMAELAKRKDELALELMSLRNQYMHSPASLARGHR